MIGKIHSSLSSHRNKSGDSTRLLKETDVFPAVLSASDTERLLYPITQQGRAAWWCQLYSVLIHTDRIPSSVLLLSGLFAVSAKFSCFSVRGVSVCIGTRTRVSATSTLVCVVLITAHSRVVAQGSFFSFPFGLFSDELGPFTADPAGHRRVCVLGVNKPDMGFCPILSFNSLSWFAYCIWIF